MAPSPSTARGRGGQDEGAIGIKNLAVERMLELGIVEGDLAGVGIDEDDIVDRFGARSHDAEIPDEACLAVKSEHGRAEDLQGGFAQALKIGRAEGRGLIREIFGRIGEGLTAGNGGREADAAIVQGAGIAHDVTHDIAGFVVLSRPGRRPDRRRRGGHRRTGRGGRNWRSSGRVRCGT